MSDHLEGLNSAQKEAVLHTEGPLLVIAGAGAGKTRVLTHRILHIIKEGTLPERILAITFTNKAAKEMRERVLTLIGSDTPSNLPLSLAAQRNIPLVSTFHALGVTILKEFGKELGLKRHFTIFDRQKTESAIKQAIKAADYDPKQWTPRKMLSAISRKKGEGMSYESFAPIAHENYFTTVVGDVWEKYNEILKKEGALDFDDLLLKPLELLRAGNAIRNHYHNRWHYIHIDEYQDTNGVQYELSKLLVSDTNNICVVGDADQTIYTWRGATVDNILSFEEDYPDTKTINLEQNYRSTKRILGAANDVVRFNTLRKEKTLFTENTEGEPITLYVALDERDEAQFVAREAAAIAERYDSINLSDIAVLYRTNFQSRALEQAFLDLGVPHQVLGTRFFDRKEVKDVLAYISLALNNDSISDLKRIINEPKRGIGKTTLLRIVSGKEHELTPAVKKKVADFWAIIRAIEHSIEHDKPTEVIKTVLEHSGIKLALENGTEEDKERLANIGELITLASRYDTLSGREGIEGLLENAALATDQDELTEKKAGVKLMTIHASKGLEFNTVFIVGLEEGLFPQIKDEATLEEQEEERRLMYVALTRAERKLYLTYTHMRTIYGRKAFNIPSSFISDIDDDHIDILGEEPMTPGKGGYLDLDDIEF